MTGTRAPQRSSLSEDISREMVLLQKHYGGKGPTGCKTFIQPNLIIVLLSGGYSPAEKTLFEAGRFVDVRRMRTAFQDTMELKFTEKIEELSGREVIAFMSAIHQEPDLALEAFVLEPELDPADTFPPVEAVGTEAAT
jgi:uncharacterized protein YbcI